MKRFHVKCSIQCLTHEYAFNICTGQGSQEKTFSPPLALSVPRTYEWVTDKNTKDCNKEHNEKISTEIYILAKPVLQTECWCPSPSIHT